MREGRIQFMNAVLKEAGVSYQARKRQDSDAYEAVSLRGEQAQQLWRTAPLWGLQLGLSAAEMEAWSVLKQVRQLQGREVGQHAGGEHPGCRCAAAVPCHLPGRKQGAPPPTHNPTPAADGHPGEHLPIRRGAQAGRAVVHQPGYLRVHVVPRLRQRLPAHSG